MPPQCGTGGRQPAKWIAWTLLALAVIAGLGATQLGGEAQAGTFFGSGACVLGAVLVLGGIGLASLVGAVRRVEVGPPGEMGDS